jgi:hypothetical protein
MSIPEPTPKVDLEDVYALLSDVHARLLALDDKVTRFEKVAVELGEKLPEALNNPMLKPFAKMLGLG